MKKLIILLIVITCINCDVKKDKDQPTKEPKTPSTDFYVGTYTTGDSEGIYKYSLTENGNLELKGLAAKAENPSFIIRSKDKKHILAVNEVDTDSTGFVSSFLIQNDSLLAINKKPSGGAHPCYISTDANNYILVANYTGGNVGLLNLDNDGKISDLLAVQEHKTENLADSIKPHAHAALTDPVNNNVVAVDLGTNELIFSKINTETQKLASVHHRIKFEDGAGPRHLTYHPNKKWMYVINELNSTITYIQKENDDYTLVSNITTLPENSEVENYCADIHISSDGNYLYASNRGHNSIAVFKINAGNGSLSLIEHVSVKGDWPRNFSLSPDNEYLLVANQRSNNIVSFKRDSVTGKLSYVSEVKLDSPVCILF